MRVPERIRNTNGVCSRVSDGSSRLSLLSLSPLEATRDLGRPVVRSVFRSVGCPREPKLGRPRLSLVKKQTTIPLRSLCHPVIMSRPLPTTTGSTGTRRHRRSPPTTSVRSSSIRFCRLSIESSRLSHSRFPNVASFSSVSPAVSGSNNRSDR